MSSPPSGQQQPDHGDAEDGVGLYGTGAANPAAPKPGEPLGLVDAMAAADRIRKAYLEREDPKETGKMVPPGTWQGGAAFAATGLLLMTPLRRSILSMAGGNGGGNGPFRGFVDLVVTPVLAVGAAQVGLVIGTLSGSSYYLDRLAEDAATTTRTTTTITSSSPSSSIPGSNEWVSVRTDRDGGIRYSPTTENLAAEQESTVAELCRGLLSASSSPTPTPTATTIQSSESHNPTETFRNLAVSESETPPPSFGSWDPRSKTMKSLLDAVDSCRRRDY